MRPVAIFTIRFNSVSGERPEELEKKLEQFQKIIQLHAGKLCMETGMGVEIEAE